MAGTEDTIDNNDKCVENAFDAYIRQLRPMQHPELTGADAGAQATKMVADMFVSLRGALAYAPITQAWLLVYAASLQRVQESTNIQ
eukprot:5565703-Pyramimonas_sp.AAC.1